MDLAETGTLLTMIARVDPRFGTPGTQDALGWHDLIGHLSLARCMAAFRKHYSESTERIMPADIRRLARTIEDEGPAVLTPYTAGSIEGSVEEPHAGEILCPSCALIHRREESCEGFARNRRPKLPRPLASVGRELTAAPAQSFAPPSPVHERALQRARAERGNVPWSPPQSTQEPPEDDSGAPREERDVVDLAPSTQVLSSLRDAPMRSCQVCVAGPSGAPLFADVPEGRAAHRAVFGHDPRSGVPQREGATSGAVD